jgi:hypothetical protein
MKNLTTIFIALLFSCHAVIAQNGLEGIIVEKYYVSDAADAAGSSGVLPVGSVTYRIFVDMLPGYNFQALYGVPAPNQHVMNISTTTSFFNDEDYGGTTPSISVNNVRKGTSLIDSYFSVGGSANGRVGVLKVDDTDGSPGNAQSILQNNDPSAGDPINIGNSLNLAARDGMIPGSPVAVTFVGLPNTGNGDLGVFDGTSQVGNLFTTDNGSVAALGGAIGPDTATNIVLVGQFTTDGIFCFELNIQIGTPSGGVENYVAANPTGNEILFPPLIYCSNVSVQEQQTQSEIFQIIPNPTSGAAYLQLSSEVNYGNGVYEVMDITGKTVAAETVSLQKGVNKIAVDLSDLKEGYYLVKLTAGSKTFTTRLVKI